MASVISYKIELDNSQATAKLNELNKNFNDTATNAKNIFNDALGVFLGNLLTNAASKISEILSKGFKDFLDKQQFYFNFGIRLGDAAKELESFNNELQKTTTYAADAFAQAQLKLSAFLNNAEDLKNISKAIADIAAASGKNITQVSEMIAAAFAGRAPLELKELGFNIDNAASSQEKLNAIIEQTKILYNDLAQEQTKTLAGSLQQLKNNFEDFIPALLNNLTPALNFLNDFIKKTNEFLTDNRFIKTIEIITKGIITAFNLLYTSIKTIIELIINSLTQAGNFIYTILIKPFVNIYNFLKELLPAFNELIKGNFAAVFESLKTNFNNLTGVFNRDIERAGEYFKKNFTGAFDITLKNAKNFWDETKKLALYSSETLITETKKRIANGFNEIKNYLINEIKPLSAIRLGLTIDQIKLEIDKTKFKTTEELFKDIFKGELPEVKIPADLELQWQTPDEKEKFERLQKQAEEFGAALASPIVSVLKNELINMFQEIFGEANSLLEKFLAAVSESLLDLAAKKAASGLANLFISGIGALLGVPIPLAIAPIQTPQVSYMQESAYTTAPQISYMQEKAYTPPKINYAEERATAPSLTNYVNVIIDGEALKKSFYKQQEKLILRYV